MLDQVFGFTGRMADREEATAVAIIIIISRTDSIIDGVSGRHVQMPMQLQEKATRRLDAADTTTAGEMTMLVRMSRWKRGTIWNC